MVMAEGLFYRLLASYTGGWKIVKVSINKENGTFYVNRSERDTLRLYICDPSDEKGPFRFDYLEVPIRSLFSWWDTYRCHIQSVETFWNQQEKCLIWLYGVQSKFQQLDILTYDVIEAVSLKCDKAVKILSAP